MAADHLRHGSAVLERLIEKDGLVVVGAEYDVDNGAVDFFDIPRAADAPRPA
jgi:carbonic anhydrase